MGFGVPVAQQVRDAQKGLRKDLRSGVVSSVIAAKHDLKQRLGLVEAPKRVKKSEDKGILSRF